MEAHGDGYQNCCDFCNFRLSRQAQGKKWKMKHCYGHSRSDCARRVKPNRRNCHLSLEDYVKKTPRIKPTITRKIENPVRHNHSSFETRSNVMGSKHSTDNSCQVCDKMHVRKKLEKSLKPTVSFNYPDPDDDDDKNKHDDQKGKGNVGYGAKSDHNPKIMNKEDCRSKLLRLFRMVYKLLKKEEKEGKIFKKRIDIEAYQVLKQSGKLLNFPRIIGPIPGIDIQVEFEFRVELMIVGLHSHNIHGIDYMIGRSGQALATSIVATEGYLDMMVKPDLLIYAGEGGLFEGKSNNAKDQELKRGNLALKNSIQEGNFIRVVRGVKLGPDHACSMGRIKKTIFIYDGLYNVVDYTNAVGPYGNKIYQFKLQRCPGQKSILWEKYK